MPLRTSYDYDPFAQRDPFERMQRRQQQIDRRLGGTPSPSMARPKQWQPLQGEEAETWKRFAVNTGISALTGVGSLLDLPGSVVRDTLGGLTDLTEGKSLGEAWKNHNPLDQLIPTNWFNNQGKDVAMGRDLLERWGVIGPNTDQGWMPDPGDLAGFAFEVATDPLSYVGGLGLRALTKTGEVASKAGTLARAIKLATREEAIRRVAGLGDNAGLDALKTAFKGMGIDDLDAVKALERKIGKREGRALTKARHAFDPPDWMDEASGLLPIENPITKYHVADAQREIDDMVAKGITPITTDPQKFALLREHRSAMSNRKWKATLEDVAAVDPETHMVSPVRIRVPFTQGWTPNMSGSKAYMGYARAVDALGGAMIDNAAARAIATHFQPYLGGLTSAVGRATGKFVKAEEDALIAQVRGASQQWDMKLKYLAEADPVTYADERVRSLMTNMYEFHYGNPTPQAAMDLIQQVNEFDANIMARKSAMGDDVSPYMQSFADTWWKITQDTGLGAPTGQGRAMVKNAAGDLVDTRGYGASLYPELDRGGENYWPRTYNPSENWAKRKGSLQAASEFSRSNAHNFKRNGLLSGIGGGDETIRQMAVHFSHDIDNMTVEQVAEEIRRVFGDGGLDFVRDAYIERTPGFYKTRTGAMAATKGGGITSHASGRYRGLAELFKSYTSKELKTGLYLNSPMADMQNLLTRMVQGEAATDGILRTLASEVRPSSAAGETVTLNRVLDSLNLRGGSPEELGALNYVLEQMAPGMRAGVVVEATRESLGNYRVPQKLYDEMMRFSDIHRSPKWYDTFINFYDTVNNIFKFHATIPFPAFHVRNLYGGQYQNLAAGMFSPWSLAAGNRLLKGELGGKKVVEIPAVKFGLEREGLALTEQNASDWLRREIHAVDLYSSKSFSSNQTIGNVSGGVAVGQPNEIATLGMDMLGRDPGRKLQGLPYVQPRTARQSAGNIGEHFKTYFRGVKDPNTGLQNTGLIPHPFAPTAGNEALKLSKIRSLGDLGKYLWTRRVMHPSQASVLKIRGVGGRTETTFGGRAMEDASHYIEGMNRVPAWLHLMGEGMSSREAAKKVFDAQIDYSARNFSRFENDIMTRVVPFYKWQSRMIPHVVRMLMEHPGGLQAQTVRASTMKNRDTSKDWTPKRVKDMGLAIPLGSRTAQGDQRYLAGVDLPFEGAFQPFRLGNGVFNTIEENFKSLLGNTSPMIQGAYEAGTGEQGYTGRDIPGLRGGPSQMLRSVLEWNGVPRWEADAARLGIPGGMKVDPRLENLSMKLGGRYVSTINSLIRPKRDESTASAVTKSLVNTLSGVKLSDYNIPQEQTRELRPAIELQLEGNPLVREFRSKYVPKELQQYLTPDDQMWVRLLETLNKESRDSKAANVQQRIKEGLLPPWAVR